MQYLLSALINNFLTYNLYNLHKLQIYILLDLYSVKKYIIKYIYYIY